MGFYDKKVIMAGNVIEVYEYEKNVQFGYEDTRKNSKGRQSTASADDKEKNREKVLSRARKDLRRVINCNIQKHSKLYTKRFKSDIIYVYLCKRGATDGQKC